MSSYPKYFDMKAGLAAIIISSMIFAISFSTAPILFPITSDVDLSWNFSTPITTAGAMQSHSKYLIYTHIDVGTVTSYSITNYTIKFGHTSNPIFVNQVFNLELFVDLYDTLEGTKVYFNDSLLETNKWVMFLRSCCTTVERINFDNSDNLLAALYEGLVNDFTRINNYQDVTGIISQKLNQLIILEGLSYLEIYQVYLDQTFIRIKIFGKYIFIQTTLSDHLTKQTSGFSVGVNFDLYEEHSYLGEFGGSILPNYKDAVNELILNVGDSHG